MTVKVQDIVARILAGGRIDRTTALRLLQFPGKQELYEAADHIRRHLMGDRFHLCSIINARSGNCTENCRFCAQSARYQTGVATYETVDADEALMMARDNDAFGVHRLSLVTSGRSPDSGTMAQMAPLYTRMAESTSMLFCASCGLLDQESAGQLHAMGVSRYHCNLETNRDFFPQVCTTHSWDEKVATLQHAGQAGMSLCSGGIIGMGETAEDRLSLAFELREIGVDSIPLNILTPIEGTPLAELVPLSIDEVLTTIALFRFINPATIIRLAGGRQQLGSDQYRCFSAGANGAIVGNYLTTLGSSIAEDLQAIAALGYTFDKTT